MKNSALELPSNNASIEATIKNIYIINGSKTEEINNCKLIISNYDNSLIELVIIISIPTN
ncbi:hypothetical protein [Clostridium cellulovorans]|uniref:Uncharacterized protein n=1 Tax=Clostridium cellulovorans (strain ATCC 35296 / DSM 3052 / OCM 3 / 743B) TaxID=573061 RepID=D9SLX3_CLOC7|nr:hypothetical protein [Clostridium cellulovorans]ADL51704.1 hypothetical protein Clocel_1960 [Clostridium cellulovorans 743B]